VYFVERLRDGKSYVTRSVKAVQSGRVIFIMLCSFQKPEPWQPVHQWLMPDVPSPEECEDEEVTLARVISNPNSGEMRVKLYREMLSVRFILYSYEGLVDGWDD